MYVLWKMKLFLCISLADISSSAVLIYASTLSFWNPGNSLLTGFFIGTLILYKLFFAHRIHIATYPPLSSPQNQPHTRLNILQWISFVLRIRKQTLITAYSPPHSLPASPSLSSHLTYLPSCPRRGQVPSHPHIGPHTWSRAAHTFYPVNAAHSSDSNLIILSLRKLSSPAHLFISF